MQQLNSRSTHIFNQLLAKLGDGQHLRLEGEGGKPLVLEKIGEGIRTPFGRAVLYSLARYTIQKGDARRVIEMTFLVANQPKKGESAAQTSIFPASFQLDNPAIYQESIMMDGHKIHTVYWEKQISQVIIAETWLNTIKRRGFL